MPIRVLIVDDSPFAREVLCEVLSRYPDIEVVGQAGDGKRAETMVTELRPDVVTMDVIMPMVGGLEAIKAIMERCPTPIIVVADRASGYDGVAGQAIEAGAIATFGKPRAGFAEETAEQLAGLIRDAAHVRVQRKLSSERGSPAKIGLASQRLRQIQLVGIVASTGGPQTLQRLIAGLDADIPYPIAVVQHTSVGFTEAFTTWLARDSHLPVQLARDGCRLVPGTITVAPDEAHLEVRPGGIIHLHQGPKLGGHRPSGTLLLRSLAASFSSQAAGVVLTGMGDDGAEGARAIEERGGLVFVEDPETAILGGMPKATIGQTRAPIVGTAEDIGRWLTCSNGKRGPQ